MMVIRQIVSGVMLEQRPSSDNPTYLRDYDN
jgi:hypothetical protein